MAENGPSCGGRSCGPRHQTKSPGSSPRQPLPACRNDPHKGRMEQYCDAAFAGAVDRELISCAPRASAQRGGETMSLWLTLAVNSVALGSLLFLLSSGFSLIFGLMRIPNLMHGSFFMLGAYFGVTLLWKGVNFWLAALISATAMAAIGGLIERFLLRRLEGQVLPQVLLTLGFAFIIGDLCLML